MCLLLVHINKLALAEEKRRRKNICVKDFLIKTFFFKYKKIQSGSTFL